MSRTRVSVTPGWEARIQHEADKFIEHELNPMVAADIRRGCPVASGLLISTIRVDGKQIRIGSRKADYWWAVEFGTRAHDIIPVRAKALSWPGAQHPVKAVHHPGTQAEPFIRPAVYRKRG